MSEGRPTASIVDRTASALVIIASITVLSRIGNSLFHDLREIPVPSAPGTVQISAEEHAQLSTHAGVPFEPSETLGNLKAKIAIVEYVDFECSFCASVALDTLPSLRSK